MSAGSAVSLVTDDASLTAGGGVGVNCRVLKKRGKEVDRNESGERSCYIGLLEGFQPLWMSASWTQVQV